MLGGWHIGVIMIKKGRLSEDNTLSIKPAAVLRYSVDTASLYLSESRRHTEEGHNALSSSRQRAKGLVESTANTDHPRVLCLRQQFYLKSRPPAPPLSPTYPQFQVKRASQASSCSCKLNATMCYVTAPFSELLARPSAHICFLHSCLDTASFLHRLGLGFSVQNRA